MRTRKEIVERCKAIRGDDFMGFRFSALLEFVDSDMASSELRERFKDDADFSEWPDTPKPTKKNVLNRISKYMPFAIGKAEDERGISASRSVGKMTEWMWLLGNDDLEEICQDDRLYGKGHGYGLEVLRAVCEKLDIEFKSD